MTGLNYVHLSPSQGNASSAADSGQAYRPIRIAIVGCGLAGAAAAGALSRLPDVQVTLYERSECVREVGALIGVMVSGVKALSRMLTPTAWDTFQQVLYRGEDTEGIHHCHWRTGEIMATAISPETPRNLQEGRTGRPALHKLLMDDISEGVIEYGSKVVSVEKLDQGMRLHFESGTSENADLVVAADGLYSKLRKQYVPDEKIQYRGQVSYRQNFPVELVANIEGIRNNTSVWKRGRDAVFLSCLEPGVYSFVAFLTETE